MLVRTTAATLATLVVGTAFAAPETYNIDPMHTVPTYEINHLGFSTQRGRFNKVSGTIVLDRAKHTVSADISIDVNSLNTGVEKLDTHLRSEDFFDAAKYPTITFKSTGAKFEGDKLEWVMGDLTMRGVTKPVKLTATAYRCGFNALYKKDECAADVTTVVKRSDFGISYALPAVGDEVRLLIPVEAHKNP